jgi:hypothetical protein
MCFLLEASPWTLRTGAPGGFRDVLALAPGGIPTIGGIRQYFADRLMAPDSLAKAVGQATAFRVAISGRGDVLTGQHERNAPGGHTIHAPLKDALHQGGISASLLAPERPTLEELFRRTLLRAGGSGTERPA